MSDRKLSVLLFGEGYDASSDVVELVIKAEELGFSRAWLAEHYGFTGLWCNPEPLLPICLSFTSKINIGSAGLLMRHHSPYRVANNFKLLATFFPDRVDLGYASGQAGSDFINSLLSDTTKDFTQQIIDCSDFLNNDDDLLKRNIPVAPFKGDAPNEWVLTSKYATLDLALKHGFNVGFSIFHGGTSFSPDKAKINEFRARYFEKFGRHPQITLAFAGVCHNSNAAAQQLYEESSFFKNDFVVPNFIGTPDKLDEWLVKIEANYGINDFTFMNLAEHSSSKLIGYELISKLIPNL